jgi:hypothetical protein
MTEIVKRLVFFQCSVYGHVLAEIKSRISVKGFTISVSLSAPPLLRSAIARRSNGGGGKLFGFAHNPHSREKGFFWTLGDNLLNRMLHSYKFGINRFVIKLSKILHHLKF